jgi:hypothetical protein
VIEAGIEAIKTHVVWLLAMILFVELTGYSQKIRAETAEFF